MVNIEKLLNVSRDNHYKLLTLVGDEERKKKSIISYLKEKNLLEKAWQKLLDRAKNGRRKIKNVRKEALKYGFTKCYQEENYEDIVTVSDRLYKSTLEKSGDILDFVDIARLKLE